MFNPVKELNQLFVASAGIFSRLGAVMSEEATQGNQGHRPREEHQCLQILCLLKGIPEK
jgi:hypothetical protein